jgi:hypothetical protein
MGCPLVGSADGLPMMDPSFLPLKDCRESSYKCEARRSHVLGITPHRTVKTLRLGIRHHRRIGVHSRSESRVCTCPPESGPSRFLCEFSS